jgi:hypothetical protein
VRTSVLIILLRKIKYIDKLLATKSSKLLLFWNAFEVLNGCEFIICTLTIPEYLKLVLVKK